VVQKPSSLQLPSVRCSSVVCMSETGPRPGGPSGPRPGYGPRPMAPGGGKYGGGKGGPRPGGPRPGYEGGPRPGGRFSGPRPGFQGSPRPGGRMGQERQIEPGFYLDKNVPGFRSAPVPKGKGKNKQAQQVINYQIKCAEVRVQDATGNVTGVMPTEKALQQAQEEEKDMILINANAVPPLVRIIEYGKFMFEKEKAMKQKKKEQRENKVEIKEVKMRVNIDEHDYNVKLNAATGFLKDDGDKVKVLIPLRGREAFKSNGEDLLNKFLKDVGDIAKVESPAKKVGKDFVMILAPKRQQ